MKQYVMICNESNVEVLKYITGAKVDFLEVQGLPHADAQGKPFNILVTPSTPAEVKALDAPSGS